MSDRFSLHGSPHSLPTYRIAMMLLLRLRRTGFTFRYGSFQRGNRHLMPISGLGPAGGRCRG